MPPITDARKRHPWIARQYLTPSLVRSSEHRRTATIALHPHLRLDLQRHLLLQLRLCLRSRRDNNSNTKADDIAD